MALTDEHPRAVHKRSHTFTKSCGSASCSIPENPGGFFAETHTVTLEGITLVVQAVVPQGELVAVEGPKEPEVPDPILATSALPTSQSMFSSHGVSHQFQPLIVLPYSLLLIHQ